MLTAEDRRLFGSYFDRYREVQARAGDNPVPAQARLMDDLNKRMDEVAQRSGYRDAGDLINKDDEFRDGPPQPEPIKNDPADNGTPARRSVETRPGGGPARSKDYRSMFGYSRDQELDTGGFDSAEEFFQTVHAGRADQRLDDLARRNMAEKIGSGGGFAVPVQYASEWLDSMLEDEIVRPRATVWPMTSNSREVPGFDSSNHSSNLFGGLTAYWGDEGGQLTSSDAKTRKIKLEASKMHIYSISSNELLADGMDFENQLGNAIISAGGWNLDYYFFTGTGAGQPLGIFNADCLISISGETGQDASTIVYENLAKILARLHPACYNNAVWVANPTTIPQLLQLSVPVGTGGSHVPAMTESSGQFRLLTLPVVFTEKVPALGSAGCIGLYDFTQYAIGLRKDMALDRSEHIRFDYDETAYRLILRADGEPKWDAAITPKNGDSLSCFVRLDAIS